MVVQVTRWRFTVSEYHRMVESGILKEADRVELIDGEVVEMTPIGSKHSACIGRLIEQFVPSVTAGAVGGVQNPIDLSERSEPEPDLALLRRRPDFYASGHPTTDDVLLLIEVSDTSLEFDRRVKVPLYARSGIPDVWLVDLEHETITVYRDPGPDGYTTAQVARRGDLLAPVAFPDRTLTVADVLG